VTPLGVWGWYTGTQAWLPVMNDIPSGKLLFDKANTPIFWEAVWTFLAVELFDSFGTIVSTVEKAGLMTGTAGQQLINRAMTVDGFGLMLGSVIGSNSITVYIESLTGIAAGARTGFASVVTGSAFLLSLLFVAPFVVIIPNAATCAALVYVGVLSLASIRSLDFDNMMHLWTAFLTIVRRALRNGGDPANTRASPPTETPLTRAHPLPPQAIMGFTYSIFNGITFGFITFSFIQLCGSRPCARLRCSPPTTLTRPSPPLLRPHRILAAADAASARVPALARWLKPVEGTDCSLPHPIMIMYVTGACGGGGGGSGERTRRAAHRSCDPNPQHPNPQPVDLLRVPLPLPRRVRASRAPLALRRWHM
jgi:hypothetical protein